MILSFIPLSFDPRPHVRFLEKRPTSPSLPPLPCRRRSQLDRLGNDVLYPTPPRDAGSLKGPIPVQRSRQTQSEKEVPYPSSRKTEDPHGAENGSYQRHHRARRQLSRRTIADQGLPGVRHGS